MAITKEELKNLVKDAAKELEGLLKAESASSISKASASSMSKGSASSMDKALEAKEPEKSPSPAPKDDKKLSAPEDAASTAAATPAEPSTDVPGGEAPAVDGAAAESGDDGDFGAQLVEAYEGLDDDELCDHYMALKHVLRGRLQAEAAGGAEAAAPAIPGAEKALACNEDSTSSMSKAEESSSSSSSSISKASASSMSKDSASSFSKESASSYGSISHGSAGSLSKESPDGHKNGGETKAGKYPTGDAGAAPDKEAFPAHEHGQDYPVAGKKGGSGKVEEGGTGRQEAVGKAKGAPSPDRLYEVGQVSKEEEFEQKLEVLTKAVELIVKTPQRKTVTDRWELGKTRICSSSKAESN